jgi:SPP1 gp7 family putative phage head morphogenesis protein
MIVLLRKYFNKQERRVLSTVKSQVNFNFNLAKETTRARMDFTPFIRDIVAKYGDETFEFLGLTGFDNSSTNVRSFLKKDGLQFAKDINKTTKKRISNAIADGTEAGESIVSIRNRVRDVYKQASTSRAMTIARTEISRASTFATVEGYKQSKVVKGKEWLAEFDSHTCELCSSMHGEVVSINENFSLGGDPPGVTHPNCRCLVLPVLKEIKSNIPKKSK